MNGQEAPALAGDGGWRPTLRHAAAVVCGYVVLHAAVVSPALWRGRLLLEGSDSAGYHYPAVYGPSSLWEPNLLGGYPRLADPQMMTWYPPALLLRLTGAEWLWNPFVLSAGVLASAFTYGLAYRLTASRLGAALAGTVYGLGSFLTLHVLHLTVIHAAAWVPLVLWSLEELRRRGQGGWVLALALGVAHLILAGHPQEGVYGLALAALYVAVHLRRAPAGWRAFGASAVLGLVLGLGLTAVQTLPTAEFVRHSGRQDVPYGMFVSFALPARQWPMLLFPFAYGGGSGRVPYFGKWNLHEVSGFCGLLSLVLAVTGFLAGRRTREKWLWAGVALVALLVALGNATPACWLLYRVPLFNKFRCPARLFLAYQLAVAVLAASGVRALRDLSRRDGARALGAGTAVIAAALAVGWGVVDSQTAPSMLGRVNPELGRPLVFFAVGTPVLWGWFLRPGRVATALLAVAFVADVTQGGCYNLTGSPGALPADGALRRTPAALEALRAELEGSRERLLAADFYDAFDPAAPPSPESILRNLPALWGLANAEGYSPLEVRRQRELLTSAGRRTAVELLGIRYRVRPEAGRLVIARHALPLRRTWLVGRVEVLPADRVRSAVIDEAPLPDGTPFRPYETALVEEAVPFDPACWDRSSEATLSAYEPCRVAVKAHAPGGGFLVLGDVNYPGWRATLDGRPTTVYQTDYVLRGVVVPPGDHVIEFRFRPASFSLGLCASVASAALLLGLLLGGRRLIWAGASAPPWRPA